MSMACCLIFRLGRRYGVSRTRWGRESAAWGQGGATHSYWTLSFLRDHAPWSVRASSGRDKRDTHWNRPKASDCAGSAAFGSVRSVWMPCRIYSQASARSKASAVPFVPPGDERVARTVLRFRLGFQPFSSSRIERQTVPLGKTLGWKSGGVNLPVRG